MKIYTSKILEQIKGNYIVGTLETDPSKIPNLGDSLEAITFSQQMNDIIFYVKPLSQEPTEIAELSQQQLNKSDLYIGFASKSIEWPIDFRYGNDSNLIQRRIDYLKNKMEGKLLLFNPVLRQQESKERVHKNLGEVTFEGDYISGREYIAVPRILMAPEEFEDVLLSEKPLNLESYNHAMPAPLFLLCGEYIYGNILDNQWKVDSSSNESARVIIASNNIKKVKIKESILNKNICSDRGKIVFIDDQFIGETVSDMLNFEGLKIGEWEERDGDSDESMITKEKLYPESADANNNEITEIDFIEYLEMKAYKKGLVYSKEDLINFHTSLKSSVFTILSGQSGTGKTQLAILYAESLGLTQDDKTVLVLPVSPSYTEPGDILGYLNPSSGLFVSAETGLTDFLIHAQNNPKQTHMLILDEMNLSQIEHYFSPFLSLLELNEENRRLKLYSSGAICHNNQVYTSSIQLRNNLIIVGTMNVDETTKDLSDRLLDRSNIITLRKQSFSIIKRKLEENKKIELNNQGAEDVYGQMYVDWKITSNDWSHFSEVEMNFFDQLDSLISNISTQKGLSIRNIMRMGLYIQNLPDFKEDSDYIIDRSKAIDLFIKQRIITKIRGSIEEYEELIGTVSSNDEIPTGDLFNLLNDRFVMDNISSFVVTKEELIRKARELGNYGYAT